KVGSTSRESTKMYFNDFISPESANFLISVFILPSLSLHIQDRVDLVHVGFNPFEDVLILLESLSLFGFVSSTLFKFCILGSNNLIQFSEDARELRLHCFNLLLSKSQCAFCSFVQIAAHLGDKCLLNQCGRNA